MKTYKRNTLAVHGGQNADPTTGARAVPIYQTTSYVFEDTEHAARLFGLEESGNIYTRIMNPTTAVLEERVALLEGGVGALAVASGQAAITLALLNIAGAGDEIIASKSLYGGTYNLFAHTLPRLGISVKFVDPGDPDNFSRAITSQTRAVFAETLGNPKLDVLDIAKVADAVHKEGVPLIIDNTVPTPCLVRPLTHGADIVVHSATKFIGGHGNSIGGIIVDGGRFDWSSGRFAGFTKPDPSYHGLNYVEAFKEAAYIAKARVQLLRDLGPSLSPFNAFLLLQGLETLPLRMERHSSNALKVAHYLQTHPAASWVNYPGLPGHPSHPRALHYFEGGCSAILGFGIKGGKEAGKTFINSLKLFSHLANIGDAKSLALHPASTTHAQLTPQEQKESGVTEDFIRLSIGIEDIEDIIADLESALEAAVSQNRRDG